MERIKYLKKLFITFYFIFLCVLIISPVNAKEPELVGCTMSKEYERWLELTDEEKENAMMPAYCDSNANKTNIAVSSVTSKIDSMFNNSLKGTLPSKYDIRSKSTPLLKNQSSTNGCWAFSTTTSLESVMKIKYNKDYVFSTRHIEYAATRGFANNQINEYGYNRRQDTGGDYHMAASYLANNLGPVLEESMPFSTDTGVINISEIKKKPVLDVNNIVLNIGYGGVPCTSSDKQQIKEYLYNNGAVAASTYMTVKDDTYYNKNTGAYYYNGNNVINHAITIIGWDDNYSKTNFSSKNRPKNNGAWIIQNSYGTNIGDKGYNYISYEDVRICDQIMTVTDVDDDVDDNSYILDKLGYNQFFGYLANGNKGITTAYAMNVFTKESNSREVLKEITIGSSGTGVYKIYYYEGNASKTNVSDMMLIGSGDLEHSGYVTHKLDNPLILNKGVTDFSIAVYYSMDSSTTPIPVSVKDSTRYSTVSVDAGRTFASSNGKTWSDISNESGKVLVASIKAFTDDINYSITLGKKANVILNSGKYDVYVDFVYSNINANKLDFVLEGKDGFEYDLGIIEFDGSSIHLSIRDIYSGERILKVYYDGIFVGEVEFVLNTALTSNVYKIDEVNKYIYVPAETNKKVFVSNINGLLNSTSIDVSGYIYTGLKVENYIVIVLGDVSGDGVVAPIDYVSIKNHIMGDQLIEGDAYVKSADCDNDSNIAPMDYVMVKNYIMTGEW